MRALNEAFEGAAAFEKFMSEAKGPAQPSAGTTAISKEVAEWNAEVVRKKIEKEERKLREAVQKAMK